MISSLAYFVTLLRKDFTNYCNQQLSKVNLSSGQLYFILYIGKHPYCSPKELAKNLHMDMGHTTRSITKLEQGGFLFQEQDPKDQRSHILHLTETGKSAFSLAYELFYQWDARVMADFSPEEQAQLMFLLQKLIDREGDVPCVRNHSKPF